MAEDAERLRELVLGSAWLVDVLAAVRASGLPDAWVGAGVLRDLVWGELFGGGFRPGEARHRPGERWPGIRVVPPA